MIIRAIRYIFNLIIGQFIFNQINRVDFVVLINSFTAQILALSTTNIYLFIRDLILNRITNNYFFRIIATSLGVNINSLVDSRAKRFFWLGFTSILILYKQFNLFKRLLLWPFKLGVFSFIFSLVGIDFSWILSWFNIFNFTIPQWVYIQYLSLYNNWLGWWKGAVNTNISIPNNPRKELVNYETSDLKENIETDKNKIFNRKNIYIILGVLTLVGLGIWYYYYNNNTGGAGGVQTGGGIFPPNPPAGNVNPAPEATNPILIIDNQTSSIRHRVLDTLDGLRLKGRLSREGYDPLRQQVLSAPETPLSAAVTENLGSSNLETPLSSSTETAAEPSSSGSQIRGSTTRTSPTHPNPIVEQERERLFPHPDSSTPVSLRGSDSPDSPNSPLLSSEASTSSSNPQLTSRPASPAGSTDSSETTTYANFKGKQRVMIPRRD